MVFSGVADHMTIAKEEIFGPVQSILKFTDLDEVNLGLARGTRKLLLQAIEMANPG